MTSYPDEFFRKAQDAVWSMFTDPDSAIPKADALAEEYADRFAGHQVRGTVLFAFGQAEEGLAAFTAGSQRAQADEAAFVFTDRQLKGQETVDQSLQEVGPDIARIDMLYDIIPGGPFKLPQSMTIVRLDDGGLALINLIELNEAVRSALAGLGPVRLLITQTFFHYRYIGGYLEAYPEAKLFGPPAHKTKPEVEGFRYAGYLSDDDPVAPDALEQITFEGHAFNETAFHHLKSGSLVITDLGLNGTDPDSVFYDFYCWLWGGHGRFACPHYHRLMVTDKDAAKRSLDKIIAKGFTRLLPNHGHAVAGDGGQIFAEAWAELFAKM